MNEEEQIPHWQKLAQIKNGMRPKECVPKPKKPIPRKSEKKLAEDKSLKEAGGDSEMDLFFEAMRRRMKGVCLFCGIESERNNDETYRNSIAHLLPKRDVDKGGFPSVGTNEDNWIELCFYAPNSCHTNFDNGVITWELLKDSKEWLIIREKLLNVLPLVAMEERKNKLYSRLNELVYGKEKI